MKNHLNNNSPNDLVPSSFYLGQNYPNPFKEKTKIKYCIAYKTRVRITVYDKGGDLIEKLVDEVKQPGTYEVEFTAADARIRSKGTLADEYYFYQMVADDFSSERRMNVC